MVLPQSKNQIPRKELTPDGKSNSDYGAIPAFFGGCKGEFLGRLVREDEVAVEGVLGGAIAAGTGSLPGGQGLRARGRAGAPQRFLRTALRDHLRDAGATDRTGAGPELFAARAEAVSAVGTGGDDADPGGLSARDLDPAGGAGGSHGDPGGGQRPDGFQAGPELGPPGASVSSSEVEGRVGVLISRRGERGCGGRAEPSECRCWSPTE